MDVRLLAYLLLVVPILLPVYALADPLFSVNRVVVGRQGHCRAVSDSSGYSPVYEGKIRCTMALSYSCHSFLANLGSGRVDEIRTSVVGVRAGHNVIMSVLHERCQ